jgi:hypothetical protein
VVAVETGAVLLELPFRGRWRTENSPARRVPSHGIDLFGQAYAIDFVAVDDTGRSAPRGWRSFFSVEAPEGFVGFGKPILAPASGTVVAVHDGEPDHVARRSQFSLVPYALGQARRVREGLPSIAGNHVTVSLGPSGPWVWLAHLRQGTIRVRPGDEVSTGDWLGDCGNSGNSTEPHVHVQVMDSLDPRNARGRPIAFRSYRLVRSGRVVTEGMPGESEIIEPVP